MIKTEVIVNQVNYIDVATESDIINEITFSPLIKSIPRKQDLKINTQKKPDIKWSKEESSFNEITEDNEVF